MITGAAPCSKEVLNFARVAFGVNFTEGEALVVLKSAFLTNTVNATYKDSPYNQERMVLIAI